LNEKLGFMWAMDQAIPTHTPGTVGGDGTTATKVKAETAVGLTSLVVTVGATNALDLNKGDVINIAGDTTPYVITADATGNAAAEVTLSIYPGLKATAAADAEVTCIGTSGTAYTVNLGFHRDAFAFATRPLVDSVDGLGNYIKSAVDPVSGMALRLEVTREHKRTRYSFDVLYGVTTVRKELACRLLG
jgi:hypothetical protein